MTCTYCAEEIPDGCEKCPSCGEHLVDRPSTANKSSVVVVVGATLLLVGCCGMAALAALVLPGLQSAKRRAKTAVGQSHVNAMRAALAAYQFDMGHYPRCAPKTGEGLLADDAAALRIGLVNPPAQGGGPNGPYLVDWPAQNLGKTKPYLLLDPWGNPYHYREWASVPAAVTSKLSVTRTVDGVPIADVPHWPEGFDLWSDGPNGINEWGAPGSDDVTSWRR